MKTKLISLLLLVMLVSSLFTGCSLGRGNTDTGGESGGDVYPTLDLYFHYIPKETSYAKVEVIDFNGGVYTRERKIPDGVLEDSSADNIDDDSGDGYNFSMSQYIMSGQTVYLKVQGFNEFTSGVINVCVTQ